MHLNLVRNINYYCCEMHPPRAVCSTAAAAAARAPLNQLYRGCIEIRSSRHGGTSKEYGSYGGGSAASAASTVRSAVDDTADGAGGAAAAAGHAAQGASHGAHKVRPLRAQPGVTDPRRAGAAGWRSR